MSFELVLDKFYQSCIDTILYYQAQKDGIALNFTIHKPVFIIKYNVLAIFSYFYLSNNHARIEMKSDVSINVLDPPSHFRNSVITRSPAES